LYKDPSGNWDVSQLAADSNSDLFCIHPSDGGSKKEVATQFGRFEAGRLKVSKQNVLQAGRPVFISVVPGSKTSSRNVDFSFQYSFAIPK